MTIKETFIVWFKAARAPFLIVSIIPAILGGTIAIFLGEIDWLLFALVVTGIVMAHSAADFFDDYYDFKTGNLGNKEKQFHDSPLIDGTIKPGQVMFAGILCLIIAIATGIYTFLEVGMPVVWLMLAGAFIVFFYTAPPIRLNYRGLGEFALFLAFGPLIVFGVTYVLTDGIRIESMLAGVPIGIFIMNVGLVSNTFDYHDDVASGKRAFPVRFGQAAAVKLIIASTWIAYLSIIAGVVFNILPLWSLLMFLSLPIAMQVIKGVKKYTDLNNYTGAMTKAIALSAIGGLLLIAAYILAIYWNITFDSIIKG